MTSVSDEAVLKDLYYLTKADGLATVRHNLKSRHALTQRILKTLDVEGLDDDGVRVEIVGEALSGVATHAMGVAITRLGSANWNDDPHFQTAAAAELLGITDAEKFAKVVVQYILNRSKTPQAQASLTEHLRKKLSEKVSAHQRQLRAAVWIQRSDRIAREPKIKEKLLQVFVDELDAWLTTEGESRKRLRDLAVKTLAMSSTIEVETSPVPESAPAAQAGTQATTKQSHQQTRRTVDPKLEQVIHDLARLTRDRLQEEQRQRRVSDPIPMPVHWSAAAPHLSDHWKNIHRVRGHAEPVPLSDMIDKIVDLFDRTPSRRLVILGRGGAGKTVLVSELALALLSEERRTQSCEPVPIIFELRSWSPGEQEFDSWLVDRLIADHDFLRVSDDRKDTFAAQLVRGRHIIPILDGFDELSLNFRAEAVRALNHSLDHGHPLALTSRPQEYSDALDDVNHVFSFAAVVELDDLTVDDLEEYLPRTVRPDPQGRLESANKKEWGPVLDTMRSATTDVHGAILRDVLSTPLMVSLARSIYSDGSRQPVELLNSRQYPDANTLMRFLFDQFITSSYMASRQDGWSLTRAKTRSLQHYRRQLVQIANYLNAAGTNNLVWWRIRPSSFSFMMTRAMGFVLILCGFVGLTFAQDLESSSRITMSFVALATIAIANGVRLGPVSVPEHPSLRDTPGDGPLESMFKSIHKRSIRQLILLLACVTFVYYYDQSIPNPQALLAGVVVMMVFLVVQLLPVRLRRFHAPTPVSSLRYNYFIALIRGVICSAVFCSIILVIYWLHFGEAVLLLGIPILCTASLLGSLLASSAGWWLVNIFFRKLPSWKAMGFLEEARDRGILRQSGEAFQFRHFLLQEHLATHPWRRFDIFEDISIRTEGSF